jgi:tyrosine-protein phosphatase SIW14
MSTFIDTRRTTYGSLSQIRLLVLTIITLSFAAVTFAQSSQEQVEGVKNFGRVTDRYFRGGQITEVGVDRLARMGVRTIIDLRDKPSAGEPEACERNGIKYFKFPMNGHTTPDEKPVNEILSLIQGAKEPVYVHCSAGKHRAGTVAALYRMRMQGWSKERAWAEQQSYGFGPAGEHPELYAYVYGERQGLTDASLLSVSTRSADKDKNKDDEKSPKSKKKDDGDDDDKKFSKSKKSKVEPSRSKKKDSKGDDDEKAKDDSDKADKEDSKADTEPASEPDSDQASGRLSANASYISVMDAIERANAEGASGDLLKIDLEWDDVRSVVTWDLTFSSGTEYEFDARTGKMLGTKPKAAAKLAVLLPLELNGSAKRLLTFQEIIKKVEKSKGQSVVEMELKRTKGSSQTVFELNLSNGATVYYDAVTGEAISNI